MQDILGPASCQNLLVHAAQMRGHMQDSVQYSMGPAAFFSQGCCVEGVLTGCAEKQHGYDVPGH